jgi:SLT domain-containing protein
MYRDVGNWIGNIRNFFVSIWNTIYNNFFNILHNIEGVAVKTWNTIYSTVVQYMNNVRNFLVGIWNSIRNTAVSTWNAIYRTVVQYMNNIKTFFTQIWNSIYTFFRGKVNDIKNFAVTTWRQLISDVKTWFGKIKGTITTAFNGAKNWLVQAGKDIWNGFVAGMQSIVSGIAKTITGWGGDIIKAVKGVFGIKSPSTVMHGLGQHMMTGFINGMLKNGTNMGDLIKMAFGISGDPFQWLAKNIGTFGAGLLGKIPGIAGELVKKVPSILGKLAGMGGGLLKKIGSFLGFGGGGGASIPTAQHAALLASAASLAGVPANWIGPMNTLVARESGWNPGAINLTDSNAKAGHPSQGLAQTIPSTFAAYAIPGLGGITNPLANLVAAFRYIKATYGSIFNVQQAVGATPKGYATGGYARGLVKVGENGPELFDAGNGGHVYNAQETQEMSNGHNTCGNVTINVDKMYGNPEDAAKVAFKVRTQGMGLRTR